LLAVFDKLSRSTAGDNTTALFAAFDSRYDTDTVYTEDITSNEAAASQYATKLAAGDDIGLDAIVLSDCAEDQTAVPVDAARMVDDKLRVRQIRFDHDVTRIFMADAANPRLILASARAEFDDTLRPGEVDVLELALE
jgi:hypothetical protein